MHFVKTIYLILCWMLFSCNNHSKSTFDYGQLQYDSSRVTILKWDTLNSNFPKNSTAIPINQFDIQVTDSLLRRAVDSFNKSQEGQISELMKRYEIRDTQLFLLDLNHYRIEYYPFRNVNGINTIFVNCFCDDSEQSKKYQAVWGKRRSYCHIELSVELEAKKSSAIIIDYYNG